MRYSDNGLLSNVYFNLFPLRSFWQSPECPLFRGLTVFSTCINIIIMLYYYEHKLVITWIKLNITKKAHNNIQYNNGGVIEITYYRAHTRQPICFGRGQELTFRPFPRVVWCIMVGTWKTDVDFTSNTCKKIK